jgi:predicted metalloprotease with PDZ domain
MIQYTVSASKPLQHLLTVSIQINIPDPSGQRLSLPNWILGSYLIRDFSKHLNNITAQAISGKILSIKSLEKSLWQVEKTNEAILIEYQVYAWDLSVRGAHFDQHHAFFNGTSLFMQVLGQEDCPCAVLIESSNFTEDNNWKIATTLPELQINDQGFGQYQAQNYTNLIEYPVEMGTFIELNFTACDIAHKVAITGKFEQQKLDKQRIINDLTHICEVELNLFGKPYPFKKYLFQIMIIEDGYGGLEHTNSTALLCARKHLPYLNTSHPSEDYHQFLELCSHEYFHSWNVKRIKPVVYKNAKLDKPVYTNQLWWFEGITSFYDGLFLNHADIVNSDEHLNRLAKEMTRAYRIPGRFQQSVAESSWLTWTKFYQQDENAPNSIISYYTKGSLIALGLDLIIRAKTNNKKSLDNILLTLWKDHGLPNKAIEEFSIEKLCSQVSGIDFTEFFNNHLYGTKDLNFTELFKPFGIQFKLRPATSMQDLGGSTVTQTTCIQLGATLTNSQNQSIQVTKVLNEQSLSNAGISSGDEIVAINGYKMNNTKKLATLLQILDEGDIVECHYFRRDELYTTKITLNKTIADRVELTKTADYGKLKWLKN